MGKIRSSFRSSLIGCLKEFNPNNVILLFIGPVGSNLVQFADEATEKSYNEFSRDESTISSMPQVHAKKIVIPGVNSQVTLLISTSFDGKKITEQSIIQEVNSWLYHNLSRRPYVDYILYFTEPERRFDIELTPIGKYIPTLKDLCGFSAESDTRSLGDRLSFVVSTAGPRDWYGSGIPAEWMPMLAYGAKGLVFNKGSGSAADLLRRVIRG